MRARWWRPLLFGSGRAQQRRRREPAFIKWPLRSKHGRKLTRLIACLSAPGACFVGGRSDFGHENHFLPGLGFHPLLCRTVTGRQK
jgi:hypothetical protein